MRPSIKRQSIIIPRPTKASLARQTKIRNSILVSSSSTNSLNTLKPIQNEQQIKSENDLSTVGLNKQQQQQAQTRRTSTITKNQMLFKRRRSLHKLAVIVSSSSLDNSSGDGETLKQVIVASLTENVKKMDLVEEPKIKNDNKENRPTRTFTNLLRKKPVQLPEKFATEEFTIEIIEEALTNEEIHGDDDDDEPIDPTYAMDYVADIMNLLYTLERKYPIQSTFLTTTTTTTHPLTTMATMANGSATRPWKLTTKHRTIVVGWIIQLFYARFHLSQDAMHMYEKQEFDFWFWKKSIFSSIGLLDRFLQQCINSTTAGTSFVTQKNLQLIAVAAFLIAAKVEVRDQTTRFFSIFTSFSHTGNSSSACRWTRLRYRSHLHQWPSQTNGKENSPRTTLRTQSANKVRRTQLSKISTIFRFSLQFLRRYSFICSAGDEQHAIGKFLIDMALLDVSCINLAPSLVAASATYIARYLLNSTQPATFEQCWPDDLQKRSPYKTYQSLANGIRILALFLDKHLTNNTLKECEILIKRYEHEQLSQASLFCQQQRTLIHQLTIQS